MGRFFLHLLVIAAALAATAWVLPGVHVAGVGSLVFAALILGFINAIIKPVLVILTLPLTIATLGIFYLVLNGILFALAATLVPGFTVDGLGWAILGGIIVGIVSMVLDAMLLANI